ncbi:Golgi apparatus membrane protein TVP23 homolog B-like isoform X2 [Corticium candelabrum]|uniref:Golgi apparatus membrane protein TVP23 homolog B-like isoform X2 n=1 Tax=Corticium candelabrum TaxID=121492 RepID=UPI002E378513|nr:Golgi apparatus membrane protein TVP23 homolog B-like isoform X2 [Corticium candelabrum]
MASTEKDDIAFAFDDEKISSRQHVKRPWILFFHYFFRVSAVLVYLLCSWFSESFISVFITTTVLHAVDFWVVKNITGRLLVRLRWWNKVEDDGTSRWLFESEKDRSKVLNSHSRIFWTLSILGMIMTGANAYGYILCKKDSGKSIATIASEFLGRQAMKQAFSQTARPDKEDGSVDDN